MTISRPRRNRVTPFGDIEATSFRGTMMGNRGDLHDEEGNVTLRWRARRWICCTLEWLGGSVAFDTPGHYTPLFFHDEAVALAAGHRPCAQCRPEAYAMYRRCWLHSQGMSRAFVSAAEMDSCLHTARLNRDRVRIMPDELLSLPPGIFVQVRFDPRPHLWDGKALLPWSHAGYDDAASVDRRQSLCVLTPSPTVLVLKAGYEIEMLK